jgi:hypothetical protein
VPIEHFDNQRTDHSVIQNDPLTFIHSELLERRIGFALCLFFGILRSCIARLSINPDGISYLDLSDAVLSRNWHALLNAYWSPLYPFLLGTCRSFFPTTKRWELFSAHILNFGIFVLALGCFEFFYVALKKSLVPDISAPGTVTFVLISERSLWALAHMLFLWVSLDLISVWDVGADLLVSAFVYVIAGLILSLGPDSDWKVPAELGVVLGVSYFAKAVMFPLAFMFILISMLRARNVGTAVHRGVISGLAFLIVAAPLVIGLSLQKHRFTFGDSGRINYAMFVSPGGATRNWQGESQLGITAAHPTRRLLDHPPLYEFATPVGGTFPPWYDPSYWQEGRVARFKLSAQLKIVATHLLFYAELLLHRENEVLVALLTLLMVIGKSGFRAVGKNWPLILMCAACFGLYMLVHSETRFVGAYVAVLWLALLAPLQISSHLRRFSDSLLWAVTGCLLLAIISNTARAVRAVRDGGWQYCALHEITLSDRLDSWGLRPGDRIGVLGLGGIYAARLSHVKIVAEIMDQDAPEFWRMPPEKRDIVFRKFVAAGARMILAPDPGPSVTVDSSWEKIEGEPFFVHDLKSR